MTFYERLVKETALSRRQLSAVPQLVDGLNGHISRATYIAYLTEAYHHVSHTVRFLMAMGVNLPSEKQTLLNVITEYISEEVGHEEWILNDIEAAGGDKNSARHSTPNLETQVLIAYNYDYIQRKNPVGFFGMVFMLESTSVQLASQGADAIKESLQLPGNAFSYLYSHGALDIDHMKFFEKTINTITDEDDQAAIIDVAQHTFRLFANLLLSIPHVAISYGKDGREENIGEESSSKESSSKENVARTAAMQIKGKTIALTGAQGGIGRCLLTILNDEKAKVIAIGRTPADGVIQADLADNQCVESLCTDLANHDVDILINLAGLMYFGDTTTLSAPELDKIIAVNLATPIKLTQAVIPRMLSKGQGQIVNIGSIFGSLPFPYFSVYSSTKAGLKGFSDSVRREYQGRGIHVTHVSPRAVDTPFNTRAIDSFNKRTKATIDSPQKVADIIISAIKKEKSTINIGFAENMFVYIHSLLPSLVDKALVSKRHIAHKILTGDDL